MKISAFFKSSCILAVSVFVIQAPLFADVDLGNGNTCKGTTAVNSKNKTIKVSKIQNQIAGLQDKAKGQKGDKKKATQDKIKEQKDLKKLVQDCNKGKLSGGSPTPKPGGDTVAKVFTDLAGSFPTGSYNGSATLGQDIDFDITGTMSATFALNGTVFSGSINFAGTIATLTGLNKIDFSKDIGSASLPVSFSVPGTSVGDVTVQIAANGKITANNSNSTTTVNFDGQHSGNSITGTISGNFSGFPYTTNFNMSR